MQYSLTFPTGTVKYVFQTRFEDVQLMPEPADCILLIDSNVVELYEELFSGYKKVIVRAAESQKIMQQVSEIVTKLLRREAHRGMMLIGIGGGITTDITGFVAGIYMRGVPFGFVPTSLLGMVDAAIGGKNGVNVGLHKNLLGTVQQPSFILYDTKFLATLRDEDWSNGFAEVIKYACLFDEVLFKELQEHDVTYYRGNPDALNLLIERCADHKNSIVLEDEKETGKRKLLNFGHTAGHAIETLYHLPHGFAVGIGMMLACSISEKEAGLDVEVRPQLATLLQQYGLPISIDMNTEQLMEVLKMDKKRNNATVDYILIEAIGKPLIKELAFDVIATAIENYNHAGSH